MARFRASIRNSYGYVSVEGDTREEVLRSIEELADLSRRVEERLRRLVKKPEGEATAAPAKRRRGRSEAVVALENIERHLLNSGFFKQPRSTADVRQKLRELTGITFQSRKVSQALGILYNDGRLSRTGQKGDYRYYQRP